MTPARRRLQEGGMEACLRFTGRKGTEVTLMSREAKRKGSEIMMGRVVPKSHCVSPQGSQS